MTSSWSKVWRDFRQERTRTFFVGLTIGLGIAAFFAVMASYAILTRELNHGWLETNPASATLRTRPLDDNLLAAISGSPGVQDAEARRTLAGRIKSGPVEWRNLTLFVVKDFARLRVSTLKPQEGAWPPATGEILLERDAVQVAKARLGDWVTIKTASGGEQKLRFSGTVKDVGQAQARMETSVYGYITLATLEQLGEELFFDQVKLVVSGNKLDEGHIRDVTANLRQLIEAKGNQVLRVEIPEPGKHPHADLMGLFLLVMASFGLFALLLSGILVVNLMTALMAAQIRQIGVMKALGGTRWQIARIYLGQALLLGITAVLGALPVGLWGSRVLCRYFAVFLNFDITSFAVPLWVYVLVTVVGLLVPLLAAGFPVWRGCGVPVRIALDDYGVGRTSFGTSPFDRVLAGLGGLTRPVLLAIRNSFRHRTRTILTTTTLMLAGLCFMAALNVRASLINTFDHLFDAMRYDLTVQLGGMYDFEKVQSAIRKTPGVLQVEGWLATEGSLIEGQQPGADDAHPAHHLPPQTGPGGGHGGSALEAKRFKVIGLPVGTKLFQPLLLNGRRLQPGDTNALVVNTRMAAYWPLLKVGDEVQLQIGPVATSWQVVGIIRDPLAGPTAYIPLSFFEQAGHVGMTNSLRLVLSESNANGLNLLKANLDRNLEEVAVRSLNSVSKLDSRVSFDQHMLMIYIFLLVMAGILAGVGSLGLATTMSLNVSERRREMGVLRAMGATPAVVWLIVIAEGLVMAMASWLVAVLLSWPISQLLGSFLLRLMFKIGLDFRFDPVGPVLWLVLAIGLGAVASFLPAWQASRRSVREAVEYE
ncbi:MAG: FtsX-like permease family protein [Blastocatellia bacterium]|nr:FtsX-like permease family protein [Blastocatellia bacterium]